MEVYLASAGTGKTHTLVQRYIEALVHHPPYRLAAVTFTRAAAGELRDRIQKGLFELADRDHPLAPRAYTLAGLIPAAPIGTMHTFFAQLLHLGGIWLHLDPEFVRVEADEAQLFFDEEARSHLFETAGRPEGGALYDLLALYEKHSLARRFQPAGPVSEQRVALFEAVFGRHWERLGGRVLGPTELELAADRLLAHAEKDPELARRLRSRLAKVFIDEYQDTSPLQGQIFERLEGLGVPLVVVGDPKQAIYAFRNADVEVFRRAMRRAGKHSTLDTSFRHAKALVAFLNRLTQELAARNLGFGPAEAPPVKPKKDAPPGRVEAVRVLGEGGIARLRRAEARALARWVLAQHESGRPWSEIAILVRSRNSYEDLRPALVEAGVPHLFIGSRGFFNLREVRDLVQAARAALDPGDRFALGAFLRGPFGELSLLEIERVLLAEDPLGVLKDGFPKVHERLSYFIQKASAMDPVRFFEELARARVIEGKSYLERLGPRARANVDQLLFLLAGRRFARLELLLRELEDLKSIDAEAEVASGGRDVVPVYTFHGSKGLEWPAVAVFDLARTGKESKERLYVDPGTENVALAGDPAYLAYRQRWQNREKDEMYRLLYVALSRPKEALFFSYSVAYQKQRGKKGEEPTLVPAPRGLAKTLENLGLLHWPELSVQTIEVETIPDFSAHEDPPTVRAPDPELARPLAPGRWPRVTSPSALKAERLSPAYAEDIEEFLEADPFGRALGRVVGTLVHAAIAANWGLDKLDLLMRQGAALQLSEAERRRVREEVARLLSAYHALLGRELPANREQDHAELPFVHPLEAGTVIEGVIDRLYRAGGTWFLEDYKTDRVDGDLRAYAVKMGYDFQLAVYAQAIEEAWGVRPRARLVFLDAQKLVEFREDELAAALSRFDLV